MDPKELPGWTNRIQALDLRDGKIEKLTGLCEEIVKGLVLPPKDKPKVSDESAKHRDVIDKLHQVNPELGHLFECVCCILDDHDNHARGYLAAHAMREVMGRLPEYVRGEKLEKRRDNWAALFSCDPNDPVVDEWYRIQNELIKWAHLRGPQAPPDNPGRVAELLEACENLLWKNMGSHTDVANELDKYLVVEVPTAADVEAVRGFMSFNMRRQYFFRTLKHDGWLKPLRDAGFFKKPPPDQNKDGELRPVFWPESEYLARMAEKDPALVCEILLNDVPATANPFIYCDMLDAAVALPAEDSVKLRGLLCNGAIKWFPYGAPENLIKIVRSWFESGLQAEAGKLAWYMFDVFPGDIPPNETFRRRHPACRMDPHDYGECMGQYVKVQGEPPPYGLVGFLIKLLRRGLDYTDHKAPTDHSCIWRKAIEVDEDGFGSDEVLHSLISALRDVASAFARACSPEELSNLIADLEKQRWHVFQRILLNVLAQLPEQCREHLGKHLLDMPKYDNAYLRREYFQLIKCGFSYLTPEDQKAFLDRIATGPDWKPALPVAERLPHWQWRRLGLIREHLTGESRERFDALARKHGEPESDPEESVSVRFGAYSEKSPFERTEILAMTDGELLNVLQTTEFFGRWDEPSAAGLANVLNECAKERPERFVSLPSSFTSIRGAYIVAMIRGLKAARTAGKDFPVADLLKFFEELLTLKSADSKDAAIEVMKQEMAQFLDLLLDAKGTLLPAEFGDQVWRLLVTLFKTIPPDDMLAEMDKETIDITDAVMNVSRTARGDAARAVMSYLYWRAHRLGWDKIETAGSHSMKDIPEITTLLDEYLAGEPCPDVHPTIGANLPQLLWIDEDWVRHRLPAIYPEEESREHFRDLVWCGYLNQRSVITNVVRAFEAQYRRAIGEMREVASVSEYPQKDRACVWHVINYYVSGNIALNDRISLLALLWEHVPSRLLRHVYEDCRRSLDEHETEAEAFDRFRALIEFRMAALAELDSKAAHPELKGLAALICSKGFSSDWAAGHLLTILKQVDGQIRSNHWVVERMKELAEDGHVAAMLECFTLLTIGAKNNWDIESWKDELETMFELAMSLKDPALRDLAKDLADELGKRGFDGYRKRWFGNG